jgi:uncharacterized phage infection (PIP) family protein YhgE
VDTVDLAIRLTADASDATRAADDAGDAYTRMAGDIDQATRKADASSDRLSSVADASDNMASSSSQAAGGLGDLGGALAMLPGPLAGVGAGMEMVAPAIMGVTGASDLLNLVTKSTIVTQGKAKVAAAAHAVQAGVTAAATWAWTTAQTAFNAVMAANPIALAVIAIIALVAIIVIAYKKSETFRKIVDAAFRGVQKAAKFAWDWIKDNWPKLLAIITGPIGLAVLAVVKNWDKIKAAAETTFDAIKSAIGKAADKVGDLLDAIKGLKDKVGGILDKIKAAFDTAFGAILDFIQPIIDAVNDLIDKLKDVKDLVPDIDVPLIRAVAGPVAGTAGTQTVAGAGVTVVVQGSLIATSEEALAARIVTVANRGRRAIGLPPLG